jgi:NAD(P)-dependent dehydrogenase (short-subunit alcohol dehydrogenase family)
MADISAPALDRAIAKVKEIMPDIAGKLDTTTCDVSKESDVAAMVERIDSWGGCDIIFNNAGIMHADDAGSSTSP